MTIETKRKYEEALANLFRATGSTEHNDLYVNLREHGYNHSDAIAAIKSPVTFVIGARRTRTCDEDFQHP